jgi:hypothetical protein
MQANQTHPNEDHSVSGHTNHFERTPMMASLRSYGYIVVAVVCLAPATARAGIVVYNASDPGIGPGIPPANSNSAMKAAQFDAAISVANFLTPEQIITFEGLPLNTPTIQSNSLTVYNTALDTVNLSLLGTDHTPPANNNFGVSNVSSDALTGYNTTQGGSQFVKLVPTFGVGTASATFSFSWPVQAFGAYITGLQTTSGPLHVTFNDGLGQHDLTFTGTATGGIQFIGFTDRFTAIHSVTIGLENVTGLSRDVVGIDDVRFSTDIPEPSSAVLLGMGLAGLAAVAGRGLRSRSRGRRPKFDEPAATR